MSLDLIFNNRMSGSGRDRVGFFEISGWFDSEKLECSFLKNYQFHSVNYRGQKDGHRIYGSWSLYEDTYISGGFIVYQPGYEEKAEAELEQKNELTDLVGKDTEEVRTGELIFNT